MTITILEIVIGLALIYAVLAILVMQLQETVAGTLLKRRAGNLRVLVCTVLAGDQALTDRILNNPLVGALFKEKTASKGFVRTSGPSAIPPDLFARALLMELNGGTHPAAEFNAPAAFIATREPALVLRGKPVVPPPPFAATWAAVAALLPGNLADWAAFEGAIAQWFQDAGDRSNGWFKRETQLWSLVIACLLVAILDIDTFNIADALASEPQVRSAFGDIGVLVDAQRTGASESHAADASPSDHPELLVGTALAVAVQKLGRALEDSDVKGFRVRQQLPFGCKLFLPGLPAISPGVPRGGDPSSSSDWQYLLPNIATRLSSIGIVEGRFAMPASPRSSNDAGGDERTDDLFVLQSARACIAAISAPVNQATTVAGSADAKTLLVEGRDALAEATKGIDTMIARARPTQLLSRKFLVAPEDFKACAEGAAGARSAFDACIATSLAQQLPLPFGWFGGNRLRQFCVVHSGAPDSRHARTSIEANQARGGICASYFEGDDRLRLPALWLDPRAGAGVTASVGWLFSILMISLGAPFWFDVLGRVVKLRVAAQARETAPDKDGGSSAQARGAASLSPQPSSGAPFAPALNVFEQQLLPADIVRLQQALHVTATGNWDGATRTAIRQYGIDHGLPSTDAMTFVLFGQIVGRSPVQSPFVPPPGSRPQLRQPHEMVQPMAKTLMAELDFPQRIPPTETKFSDNLRALAVLHRFKVDSAMPERSRAVFDIVQAAPTSLNEVDEKLLADILSFSGAPIRQRENAPWLDWAIGELGVVEVGATTRAASNPRVCEFLDAAKPQGGDGGDATAWCGAFIAWVLKQYAVAPLPASATRGGPQPVPTAASQATIAARLAALTTPLLAHGWSGWGAGPKGGVTKAAALALAAVGDIVLFDPAVGSSSSGHVGFVFDVDVANGYVWSLGGNQDSGTRVCLSRFTSQEVAAVLSVT